MSKKVKGEGQSWTWVHFCGPDPIQSNPIQSMEGFNPCPTMVQVTDYIFIRRTCPHQSKERKKRGEPKTGTDIARVVYDQRTSLEVKRLNVKVTSAAKKRMHLCRIGLSLLIANRKPQ